MKTHTKSDATHKLDRPLWVYSSGRSDAYSICDMRLGKIHTPSHTHTHTQEFTLETRDSHGTPLRWIFRSRAIAGITGQPQVDNLALTTEKKTNKQDGTEMQIQSGYGEVYWQPQNGTRRRASGLRKKKKQKYYHKWMVIWCSSGGVEMKAIYVWPPCTFVQHTNNGTKRVTSEFPRF